VPYQNQISQVDRSISLIRCWMPRVGRWSV
jgi:hypothetical protein